MAVNVNLSRATKVYFTTQFGDTGYGDHNTAEIQVLNGYTFSQGTEQETIQINEAGTTPNRGQRSFNSKLNPVEWGFTSYIRPKKVVNTNATVTVSTGASIVWTTVNNVITNGEATLTCSTGTVTAGNTLYICSGFTTTSTPCNSTTPIPIHRLTNTTFKINVPTSTTGTTLAGAAVFTAATAVTCPEAALWNALVSPITYQGSGVPNAGWTPTNAATVSSLGITQSNVHQLAPFCLIFKIDKVYYKVKGAAVNQAEVNFGIDQIAQIAWSGFGTAYTQFDTATAVYGSSAVTELSAITPADTSASYITNKLSTVSLGTGLRAASTGTSGTVLSTATPIYSVPITGGAFTVNNNLTYLTPENLGVVNNTIGYFTGTRAVTGNLTAYLRTGGTTETGDLLTALLLGASTSSDNKYSMVVNIGGQSNALRVELQMDGCMLQIPPVEVQDVVSTTINFTAQSTDPAIPHATGGGEYLLTAANEFGVLYRAP